MNKMNKRTKRLSARLIALLSFRICLAKYMYTLYIYIYIYGRIFSTKNAISKCRSDYRAGFLFDQKTQFQNVVLTTEPDLFDQKTPFQNVVRTTEPDLFLPKTPFQNVVRTTEPDFFRPKTRFSKNSPNIFRRHIYL